MRPFLCVTALVGSAFVLACSSNDTPSGGSDASTTADTSTASDAGHADSGTASDTGSGADTSAPGVDSSVHDAGCATPGAGAFGAICATDCDCASTACFFGGQGSYCSIHCTAATAAQDCPTPETSGTCNNQGYCKK